MWSSSMHSGGNKRKLSTAIALVGNPSVVFLVGNSNCHFLTYLYSYVCGSLLYMHNKDE